MTIYLRILYVYTQHLCCAYGYKITPVCVGTEIGFYFWIQVLYDVSPVSA
jgi:hypothetical protein